MSGRTIVELQGSFCRTCIENDAASRILSSAEGLLPQLHILPLATIGHSDGQTVCSCIHTRVRIDHLGIVAIGIGLDGQLLATEQTISEDALVGHLHICRQREVVSHSLNLNTREVVNSVVFSLLDILGRQFERCSSPAGGKQDGIDGIAIVAATYDLELESLREGLTAGYDEAMDLILTGSNVLRERVSESAPLVERPYDRLLSSFRKDASCTAICPGEGCLQRRMPFRTISFIKNKVFQNERLRFATRVLNAEAGDCCFLGEGSRELRSTLLNSRTEIVTLTGCSQVGGGYGLSEDELITGVVG